MPARAPTHSLIARSRDADDLIIVVDRGGGPGGVTRIERQLANLVRSRTPHDRAELDPLRRVRIAVRIHEVVLRPSNHAALVVDAGGEAVGAAEGGQGPHHSPLPDEPETL